MVDTPPRAQVRTGRVDDGDEGARPWTLPPDSHRPGPRPAPAHQDVAPDRAVASVNHGHRLKAQGLSPPLSAPLVRFQNEKSRQEPTPLLWAQARSALSPGITTWRVLGWEIR